MDDKVSIVLTGVGGQGVITAASILGKAAVNAGTTVYVSEVHGMAQRGGSVVCTIRMGKVSSPLVASGTADVLVSTEPVEALRSICYAHPKTMVITDKTPVVPFTVAVGDDTYPSLEIVFEEINRNAQLLPIDGLGIAKDAGAIITKNIVMLGALAATKKLPFKSDILLKTILDTVPKDYEKTNKLAYQGGKQAITKLLKTIK